MLAQEYNATILIVDDDSVVCQILTNRLTALGYQIFIAKNDKEAILLLKKTKLSLVIIDIMLSKRNGYGFYSELKKNSNIPVIILTALGDISDRILAFECGADDYLIKPFSPKELEARIYSILRRTNRTSLKTNRRLLYFDNLTVDTTKKQIIKGKRQIHLTAIEFSIVELLATNAGKTLSRTYIFNNIWGYKPSRYLDIRVVDVHISRLRAKLENDVKNPCLILTARGIGYMFQSL